MMMMMMMMIIIIIAIIIAINFYCCMHIANANPNDCNNCSVSVSTTCARY